MNVKDFIIGACTAIVGVALGVAVCCCVGNCGKKCDKPMPPCKMEQAECCPQGECCPDGPCCKKGGPKPPACDRRRPHKACPMEMAKELNLSEEQIAQVKNLFEAQKSEMKAAKDKFDEAFKSILTDEQKAKLAEMKPHKKCDKGKKDKDVDDEDDED
ncbi:MAG: hypothetical protein IK117_01710 [Bacteroidales bacterium]|nr:hypothetical protein [Bacteroidales bacterium]